MKFGRDCRRRRRQRLDPNLLRGENRQSQPHPGNPEGSPCPAAGRALTPSRAVGRGLIVTHLDRKSQGFLRLALVRGLRRHRKLRSVEDLWGVRQLRQVGQLR